MNPPARRSISRRIVCAGEAMVELRPHGDGWHVGFGGDTLNVALHLARLGHRAAYLTALGHDPFAVKMCADWAREGIDLSLVLTHPNRTTGLYAIETDTRGERHFSYWRGESAARELFTCEGIEEAEDEAARADLLFFSLISLAILKGAGRERLLALAARVRANGGKVGFDSNYRARLWASREEAREWQARAAALADFGLPGIDDQHALGVGDDPFAIAEYWRERGCGEVVVKLGGEGCLLPDGSVVKPPTRLVPSDTSGAGDAFDAGYLAARIRGASAEDSAMAGQGLAGWTVMHRGAIPPTGEASPYSAIASLVPE
jgi:2-dehydro-3-deoxygluconokinase